MSGGGGPNGYEVIDLTSSGNEAVPAGPRPSKAQKLGAGGAPTAQDLGLNTENYMKSLRWVIDNPQANLMPGRGDRCEDAESEAPPVFECGRRFGLFLHSNAETKHLEAAQRQCKEPCPF